MNPKPIKVFTVYGTDNGGMVLTTEVHQWYRDVTGALNYLLERDKTEAEQLGELIYKFNNEHPYLEPIWEQKPAPKNRREG